MEKKLENWRNPLQIWNFFEKAKCGETHFSNLMDVSNLILFFLDIPLFSSISLKNKIIPYFMDHQEGGRQLPLVFKTPAVQQPSGQRLFLTRQCSFDMSFYQITGKAILVQYRGQEGSDYGGMIREFMMGWQGKGIGEEYFYFGRLFGISFKRSIPYGGEFDLPMAIAITGFVPDLEFVKEHDAKLYTSLNFILENDVEDLDLRFVISKDKYGVAKQFPLKENGQQTEVTNQNKQQYIDLYIKHAYSCGRQWQLSEIQAGFYSIVNRKYAEIFHPVDLIHKIRGEEIHDYMKLKKKARYEGYTATTPIIKWFWQIISTFDQKGLNKFIQFLTGAPKISIYDPHFKITIQRNYTDDEQKLPVAHTCFNTLDLPQYASKEILENKITTAIFEGNENFGLL